MFHLDVEKVELVLHIHACCKRMFQVFQLFHTYVASVLSGCCICFAMATNVCSWCFKRLLQVFQLFGTYVASVSCRCCKSGSLVLQWDPSAAATCCSYSADLGHGVGVGHGAARAPREADAVGAGQTGMTSGR